MKTKEMLDGEAFLILEKQILGDRLSDSRHITNLFMSIVDRDRILDTFLSSQSDEYITGFLKNLVLFCDRISVSELVRKNKKEDTDES